MPHEHPVLEHEHPHDHEQVQFNRVILSSYLVGSEYGMNVWVLRDDRLHPEFAWYVELSPAQGGSPSGEWVPPEAVGFDGINGITMVMFDGYTFSMMTEASMNLSGWYLRFTRL